MRFADYFGRAFSSVTASQFPWVKLLKESPVAKVADVSCFLEAMHIMEYKDLNVYCQIIMLVNTSSTNLYDINV